MRGIHSQHAKGEAHGRAVLNVEAVRYIRTAWRDVPKNLVAGFLTHLAEKFGCSIMPIQQVIDGATWKDVEIDEATQPLDKELLAELLERRRVNSAARRAARTYQGGSKCSQPVRGPRSTKRQTTAQPKQRGRTAQ